LHNFSYIDMSGISTLAVRSFFRKQFVVESFRKHNSKVYI